MFMGSRQCDCEMKNGNRPIETLYVDLFSKEDDGLSSLLQIAIASLGVALNVFMSIPIFHFVLRKRSYQIYCRIKGLCDEAEMSLYFFHLHALIFFAIAAIAIAFPD